MKKIALATLFAVLAGVTVRCEHDDESQIVNDPGVFEGLIWFSHELGVHDGPVDLFCMISGQGVYGRVVGEVNEHYEEFTWIFNGSEYEAIFPARGGEKREFSARVWECDIPPWELCVELSDDVFGDQAKFYSRWDLRPGSHKAKGLLTEVDPLKAFARFHE